MKIRTTKKLIAFSLSMMMAGCVIGSADTMKAITGNYGITADAASSGQCGTNLNWNVSGDTLIISGTGTAMKNYGASVNPAPWRNLASNVKNVILPETLKSIGEYAFYKMTALEYVYTSDGDINMPCLPDVDKIGKYAFAECNMMCGNTQSGTLTLGTGYNTPENLVIGDCAFQNCDNVRYICSEYQTVSAGVYSFAYIKNMCTLDFENTSASFGKCAFKGNKNLSVVKIKPSTKAIHNTAFDDTAYKANGCTSTDYDSRNIGAASKLEGNQLVVNIFVDRTRVNLYGYERAITKSTSNAQKLNLAPDEVAIDLPVSNYSGSAQVGVFKRGEMTSTLSYSWNAVKEASRGSDSVISLNNYDWNNAADKTSIPQNDVNKSVTEGFFGSYVSSDDIAERLDAVRSAMDNLKTESASYGASFDYQMSPETNFYITYDTFDWSWISATFGNNKLGYTAIAGYGGYDGKITNGAAFGDSVGGNTLISNNKDDMLFEKLLDSSKKLSGSNAQTIDLMVNKGETESAYTKFLKEKYNVDGVIYIVHLNTPSKSEALPIKSENIEIARQDEFVILTDVSGYKDESLTAEHEIAHLFGAKDYYKKSSMSDAGIDFAEQYLSSDLMRCQDYDISPVTAFSLGWLNCLDTDTYNTFFSTFARK